MDKPHTELIQANALLRKVIDENPNIILMKDWDGKFLIGNRALANLYGTTPDQLVGKDDGAFNSNAEQVACFLENTRAVMMQDQTQVVWEESTDAATGQTRYFQSTQVPLVGPDGQRQILVIANDVTELKQTQQRLEESERRLRYVLDATGEGIWDWDIGSGLVSHNRRWCDIVGLGDDFLQHPLNRFTGLLHPDDKESVMVKLQACLDGNALYQSEHRMIKHGQVVWVRDRGDVVERDAGGKPIRMVGSLLDISKRKEAELAASNSSKLLHEAVSSIAQGFTIYDEQDRLYLCNETYKSFYETSRDLIVPGNTFEMIIRQGAERGQYSEALGHIDQWVEQRVEQHQKADGTVIEQQLSDGRWLLIVESRTPSGFIVGNRIDITARKKAQALVCEHSAQLDAIFELSPDALVSFDSSKRVKYISPAFERLTGLCDIDVLGVDEANFSKCLAERCVSDASFSGVAALRAAQRATPEKVPRVVIELGDSASGQHCVLAVSLRESEESGVSQILYLRDITHESEVDRLKSEFLSTAAHELRTPMASIYGFSEVLLTQKLKAAERKEFLTIIFQQAELMSSILNELLDLARIEARRGKDFVIKPLLVESLVAQVVSSFKLPKGRSAPRITVSGTAPQVNADPSKAAQALLNVLSNAYKYASQGDVLVKIKPIEDGVAICVTDHGPGMTPDQVKRVGERFFRADTSGKVPGTGLGMSIVKEIMSLHHGRVDVESTPGQGTTVTLVFPGPC